MKIAVISDIHGNLPALEAVMHDIETRKIDKIICLGDLAGKGPGSVEVIDICRKNCDIVLKGNWEDGFCHFNNLLKENKKNEVSEYIARYIREIGEERLEYFNTLPHCAELELGNKLIRLFHAHPLDFSRYFHDSPIEKRMELFNPGKDSIINKKADFAVYADIHTVYMQVLDGRFLINVGSVGNPLDICQSSYLILESGESINIQFIKVPYDINKAIQMAIEHNTPHLDGYISELTTAKYFKR